MEQTELETVEGAAACLERLRETIGQALVGQASVVEQVLIALVASGHVLIEGVPGLGKTLLVRALAQTLAVAYARVQFTPDMMPSDITGHAVLDPATRDLRVVRGPIFTHILLADEINRAPAKTQSALLEVMQEYQVTLEGQTLPVPKPFMVLATQNPVETEGTYPLPEAQLDRFLFKIEIDYPSIAEEVAIVVRATLDQTGDELPLGSVTPLLNGKAVMQLQQTAARQRVDEQVLDYAVRLVRATRDWAGLAAGSGSRGALALVRGARRRAARPAQLRDAGRREAYRAAGTAPPDRAVTGCAPRRTPRERCAGRHYRSRGRATDVGRSPLVAMPQAGAYPPSQGRPADSPEGAARRRLARA